MIVAVHQPNYLPYLGLFQKMARADVLVLNDTALYSRQHGFHNRNRIKTVQGAHWMTIPVQHSTLRAIRDVRIANGEWARIHRKTLDTNYRRAPFYESYAKELHSILQKSWTSLADLNELLIGLVARWLNIPTKMIRASDLPQPETDDPTQKIIHIVRCLGGTEYVSGQGGHAYLDESQFRDIRLEYDEFVPTPYPQLYGEFVPNLSAIDAVFNCGNAVLLPKTVSPT
jgi:hypothetical protein